MDVLRKFFGLKPLNKNAVKNNNVIEGNHLAHLEKCDDILSFMLTKPNGATMDEINRGISYNNTFSSEPLIVCPDENYAKKVILTRNGVDVTDQYKLVPFGYQFKFIRKSVTE